MFAEAFVCLNRFPMLGIYFFLTLDGKFAIGLFLRLIFEISSEEEKSLVQQVCLSLPRPWYHGRCAGDVSGCPDG